jgi:hypothetical protein
MVLKKSVLSTESNVCSAHSARPTLAIAFIISPVALLSLIPAASAVYSPFITIVNPERGSKLHNIAIVEWYVPKRGKRSRKP